MQSRRFSPREEVIDQVEKHLSGSVYPTPHQAQVAPSNGGSVAVASNAHKCSPLQHVPANSGEPSGKLEAGTAEPPVKTNCTNNSRSTTGEADVGEVRSTTEGGKNSIPLDVPVEASHNVVEHEAGVATRIEPNNRSELDSFKESSLLGRAPLNVEDVQHHEGGEAPTSGAANSNGSVDQRKKYSEQAQVNIETSAKLPSAKVDAEDACEHEDHNPVRDVTGSEEVPTRRHGRVCSECGQVGGGSGRLSGNDDEAELMRCCTQILELYCPHTLKADMRTSSLYPLCCPIPRYPLPAGSTSSSKVCRSYVTQFTVDTLRAAHSTLISSTQESTSEEVVSPLRGVEQALSMAERFIEIKGRMGHVQGLIQQVDAASAQASRDFKAYGDRGAFSLASQLIPRLLSREKQQNVERAKNDVQVMTTFLQDINDLLTNCFQYVGKFVDTFLLPVDDNHATSNAVNLSVFTLDFDNKPGLEAVRTAVPLWLRMYHDVAHASGLLK